MRGFLAGLLVLAQAADASTWTEWERLCHEACPSHHVDWICGDCYLFLVENFDTTLSRNERLRVQRIADTRRRCADEVAGFSCEFSRSLAAYGRLNLLPRFVRYGCKSIRCEEAAICSRVPKG